MQSPDVSLIGVSLFTGPVVTSVCSPSDPAALTHRPSNREIVALSDRIIHSSSARIVFVRSRPSRLAALPLVSRIFRGPNPHRCGMKILFVCPAVFIKSADTSRPSAACRLFERPPNISVIADYRTAEVVGGVARTRVRFPPREERVQPQRRAGYLASRSRFKCAWSNNWGKNVLLKMLPPHFLLGGRTETEKEPWIRHAPFFNKTVLKFRQ